MSTRRKELLLCVLHRAGRPLTSGEATDLSAGLANAEGWPAEHVEELTRKSVSKLLASMAAANVLALQDDVEEPGQTRMVPTYAPVTGYDAGWPMPEPPAQVRAAAGAKPPYVDKSKQQLMAILEAQDSVIECVARFLSDFQSQTEKLRRRLAAAGLEPE